MKPRAGSLAAQANMREVHVKCSGRSHKRETEKQREWDREKARPMREKR